MNKWRGPGRRRLPGPLHLFISYYLLCYLRHLLSFNGNSAIPQYQVCYLARGNNAVQQRISQRIIDIGLDPAAQWARTILLVEAFTQQQVSHLVADYQLDLLLTQARANLG